MGKSPFDVGSERNNGLDNYCKRLGESVLVLGRRLL
jgi:hypothetical protein